MASIKENKTSSKYSRAVLTEDDVIEHEDLLAGRKPKWVNLTWINVLLLFIDFLQFLAVLQSMSTRWTWPELWLFNMRWLHIVNLDLWDFLKLSNGTYTSLQSGDVATSLMPFSYWALLVGWAVALLLLAALFVALRMSFTWKMQAQGRRRVAVLQAVYVLVVHMLTLPVGTVMARGFHCTAGNVMLSAVDNSARCLRGTFWAYALLPWLLLLIVLFALYPFWLITRIKREADAIDSADFEHVNNLVQAQYVLHLDNSFMTQHYIFFSSFHKRGVYTYVLLHYLKLFVLIAFGAFHRHIMAQGILCTIGFAAFLVAFAVLRPFRIKALSVLLCFDMAFLFADSLLGSLETSYSPITNPSPWLTPTYMQYTLLVVNALWLFVFLVVCVCLMVLQCRVQLWPGIDKQGLPLLSARTRHYFVAMLRARAMLDKCRSGPALLAPVHELERHIQIINAYCREAEFLSDAVHGPLWDTLDTLITAHGQLCRKSLFAESVKDSIRQTSLELLRLLPGFVRRLAQREYDLILVPPPKRRLLLKLYILGMFLNGRVAKRRQQEQVQTQLLPVWHREHSASEEEDGGYFEQVYPPQNEEDENYLPPRLQEATVYSEPAWMSGAPPLSPVQHQLDIDAILQEDDSIEMSDLMNQIPASLRNSTLFRSRTSLDAPTHSDMGPSTSSLAGAEENSATVALELEESRSVIDLEEQESGTRAEGSESSDQAVDGRLPYLSKQREDGQVKQEDKEMQKKENLESADIQGDEETNERKEQEHLEEVTTTTEKKKKRKKVKNGVEGKEQEHLEEVTTTTEKKKKRKKVKIRVERKEQKHLEEVTTTTEKKKKRKKDKNRVKSEIPSGDDGDTEERNHRRSRSSEKVPLEDEDEDESKKRKSRKEREHSSQRKQDNEADGTAQDTSNPDEKIKLTEAVGEDVSEDKLLQEKEHRRKRKESEEHRRTAEEAEKMEPDTEQQPKRKEKKHRDRSARKRTERSAVEGKEEVTEV